MDITAKIAKLLAQAEGAGTEDEATTFTEKAQELATLYSVDLAKARHASRAKERTVPTTKTITLGVRGTRGLNTLVSLFSGIASANDVKINIAHNSTYVVAFGFPEDIAVSEALFASLSVQMAQAVAEYKRAGEWREQKVFHPGRWTYYEYQHAEHRPITWLTARLDFQDGFAHRVAHRLMVSKLDAENKAVEADSEVTTESVDGVVNAPISTALVLKDKKEAVEDHYRKTSNARGSYRGGRSTRSHGSWDAGSAAGNRARLGGKSGSIGGSSRQLSA